MTSQRKQQARNETVEEGKKKKNKVMNHTTAGQSKQTDLRYLVLVPSTDINEEPLD